jgi:nucleoprotein TPR
VAYLRRQESILSAELQLARQEAMRLRSEAANARRAADEASAALTSQAERARQSMRTAEEHAALMQKVEQLNLLRESNAALR